LLLALIVVFLTVVSAQAHLSSLISASGTVSPGYVLPSTISQVVSTKKLILLSDLQHLGLSSKTLSQNLCQPQYVISHIISVDQNRALIIDSQFRKIFL
jgi:hypothetical protein